MFNKTHHLSIGEQRVIRMLSVSTDMRGRLISTLFRTFLAISVASTGFGQYNSYPGYPQAQPYPAQQNPSGVTPSVPAATMAGAMNDPEDSQHGVARVSIAQGDVNVKRGDNGELAAAVLNAPLMARDHLQTSPGSRAEVELDAVDFIRLAPNTDLGFADLQYRRYQAQLALGTVILRVTRQTDAQLEVDTPSVSLRPLGPGEYRISVFDNGTSQVTVRSGRLEMYGPNGSQPVEAGQTLLVRGDATNPEFQSASQIGRDQFDEWSAARDNEVLNSQSYNYVSTDVGGAQDLDGNGSWVPSQYGEAWEPQTVAPDWSPYSDGHWVYEGYYGWTWIDNAPWGWAPYHYGRWFMNSGRWCWWPGARVGLHLWSPALVGFFGFGGGLGWVALAPFEFGFSWWGHGGFGHGGFAYGGYGFNRLGFGGQYRNAAFRGGAMTAGFGSFGGPNQRFRPATQGQLAGASLLRGQLPVRPSQGAYRFSGRSAVANPRLSAGTNRQFFSQQGTGGFAGMRNAPASSAGGWQHFGTPGNSSGARVASVPERSGWHTFGQPQAGAQSFRGGTPSYSRPGGAYSQSRGYSGQSAPRFSAPAQPNYRGAAPSRAPTQHYSAPAQHYSAPQSRPSGGGGGGSHGGGGGGSHSSGGGGGSHSSGGGGGGHRGR